MIYYAAMKLTFTSEEVALMSKALSLTRNTLNLEGKNNPPNPNQAELDAIHNILKPNTEVEINSQRRKLLSSSLSNFRRLFNPASKKKELLITDEQSTLVTQIEHKLLNL